MHASSRYRSEPGSRSIGSPQPATVRSVLRRGGAVGRERRGGYRRLPPSQGSGLCRGARWSIVQLHSSEYRNRSQLREGGVLVVGAGNSGAEIAIELAGHHQTWLSGPDTGQEPTRAGSIPDRLFTPIMWLMATRLTVRTAMGRKLRDHFLDPPRGIPLGRVRRKDIIAAGIERVGRTTGVRDGRPLLDDGRVLDVSNVIWCTGYTPDFSWIDLPLSTPPRMANPGPWHRRVCSWSLLHGAPVPLLTQLGAAGRSRPGRRAHRRPHRFQATATERGKESSLMHSILPDSHSLRARPRATL